MMKSLKIKSDLANVILMSLKSETVSWRGNIGVPTNPLTNEKYKGINALLLDSVASQRNYKNNWWATYNQWHAIGFQVQRRPQNVTEWGVGAVSWMPVRKITESKIERFSLLKKTVLFNAEQVFGLNLKQYLSTINNYSQVDYSAVISLVNNTQAVIDYNEDCDLPHYSRIDDIIVLPPKSDFSNEKQYFATLIHELFHWSESRLQWSGSESQSELIAEIGTGFFESAFGLPHDTDMANYRKYLPEWIHEIEKSADYLFEAAFSAHQALEYILKFDLQHTKTW